MPDTTLRFRHEVSLAVLVHDQRKVRGWSQKRLADKAGISVYTIGRIESARIEPERNTLECVLGALGYSLIFAVERKGEETV